MNDDCNLWFISLFNVTVVPATVFCDVRRQMGGIFTPPPGISRILEHIATKFQRLSPYFRCQAFYWCNFRYRVTSISAKNPRWRPPKWNVHILRLYGWRRIISNTQWAIFSVHDRGVRILEWHLWQTWAKPRWRLKPEVVLTSARNKISARVQRLCPWFLG